MCPRANEGDELSLLTLTMVLSVLGKHDSEHFFSVNVRRPIVMVSEISRQWNVTGISVCGLMMIIELNNRIFCPNKAT